MYRGSRAAKDSISPDGVRRVFNLDLRHERWDPLFKFHAETMHGTSIQDCVRELLAAALATAANDHGWIEARRQAIGALRREYLNRVATSLTQIAADMTGEALAVDVTGGPAGAVSGVYQP